MHVTTWHARSTRQWVTVNAVAGVILGIFLFSAQERTFGRGGGQQTSAGAPTPLLNAGHPVDWWVVFKFNASSFPGCGANSARTCTFGGTVQPYPAFGQQFAFASSEHHALEQGTGCAGETTTEPLGATFEQVYDGSVHYLIWNDQFYQDPAIRGCGDSCGSPWGHSKGLLAWNDSGDGVVLQVSTPSWPAAGSKTAPRRSDGNTLGCVKDDDVKVSQHFFALKLTKDDLVAVLKALANASVVTDATNDQVVRNGGPADVQALVKTLGKQSTSTSFTKDTLSSGVTLISKPSRLHVPPWQLVSAVLGGASLRTATWWASPKIPTTTSSTHIGCWDMALAKPGAVEIATSGSFAHKTFGLTGGAGSNFNHAKIGVSTSGSHDYSIFGDMNQQGSLSGPNCGSSQNGRGGLFFVVEDHDLWSSLKALMTCDSCDTAPAQ
jgi:hypothetical protein